MKSENVSRSLCPTPLDPLDCSPPGFLCPWNSLGKDTGMGSHSRRSPSPGDLPDPEIKLGFPALQAYSLPSEPPGKPIHSLTERHVGMIIGMLQRYFRFGSRPLQ